MQILAVWGECAIVLSGRLVGRRAGEASTGNMAQLKSELDDFNDQID